MKRFKLHKIGFVSFCLIAPFASYADDAPSTPSTTATTSSAQSQSPQTINDAAFQQVLSSYFPLTPAQIHQFKDVAATQQEANAAPPGDAPPEGTSSIIPVTLKPGGDMPVIRIGRGMITSLVFTDASGQVWPIVSYSIGDPTSFAVQWDKSSGVLMIQGQKLYAQTNVGVMLQGMEVPVMLNLLIGQKNWDYLDYVQLDQNQPGDPNVPDPVSQAPGYLVDLLNGIPPQGAVALTVSDSNAAQVWSYGGQYIMLTRATLLSPAWTSRANGPGPTPYHAYALTATPELLISNMGNLEKLIVNPGNQNAQTN